MLCRIVLEMDPSALVQRVAVRHEDLPLGEQRVAQVLKLIVPTFVRQLIQTTCPLCAGARLREGRHQVEHVQIVSMIIIIISFHCVFVLLRIIISSISLVS